MSAFDTPLIKAFFTDETIREARGHTAQVSLETTAPFVYQTTIGDVDVQLDGAMFPGCSECTCAEFREGNLCAHLCVAAAQHFGEQPEGPQFLLPDDSAAVRPEFLEHPCFYELHMLPFTYSPAYEGQTITETILNRAVVCRGKVEDPKIAAEVLRILNNCLREVEEDDQTIDSLFSLLEELNAPAGEIESLKARWAVQFEYDYEDWEEEWEEPSPEEYRPG